VRLATPTWEPGSLRPTIQMAFRLMVLLPDWAPVMQGPGAAVPAGLQVGL
jgi:hypothetical protein